MPGLSVAKLMLVLVPHLYVMLERTLNIVGWLVLFSAFIVWLVL